jgi:tetratricopeptide (TPR) repeat protein
MPSLQVLRDFKASFDNIGGEKAALAEQNLPFEDLPFPEVEAELPGAEEKAEGEADSLDNLAGMNLDPDVAAALGLTEAAQDLGAPADDTDLSLEAAAAGAAQGEFDLDALLGSLPGEIPAEIPGKEAGIPEGLLDGLADDIEGSPPDEGAGIAGDSGFDDAGFDLGDAGLDDGVLDLDNAVDLGGEDGGEEAPLSAAEGSAGDQGFDDAGFELGGTGLELGETGLELGESLDLGEGIPAPPEAAEAAGDSDLPGLDLNLGEGFDGADLKLGDADPFENFDLEGISPAPLEDETEPAGELGDYSLPGIDDMLGGLPGGPSPQPGKGGGNAFGARPKKEAEPEEISLGETDLANFHRTLAAYPLNLRLAVEEIIAERAVPPEQMSELVRLLVRGALPREAASLAGKILDKPIKIPRGFQKKTGEQMEEEQKSFSYFFVHSFLPIFGLFFFIAVVAASSFYLIWRFIYTPVRAENIYRLGYDRIAAGEYERANQRFSQAFDIHRDKKWFYRYAEAFRDQRQYIYAEEKYDELLRQYPRDKKGVLDYAAMETYYRRNYEKADRLIQRNILEFNPNDQEALLAQGDNALAWGEVDPRRYEDARFAYARLLERYGWTDPVAERMLKYFIRTDNLKEVIPLQSFFMDDPKKKISAETLAELGGYLLDKRSEEVRGVPDEYRELISGVRDVLLRAVLQGPGLPEAHYHLSRYYRNLGSGREEQQTLEVALRAFDRGAEESVRRVIYHIEALERDAEILSGRREYFAAEERLVKAVGLYENALDRRLLAPAPQFGRLYAAMGDLEYFTKSGDMEMTLAYYQEAEKHGYAPPEVLYRMGAAHYQQEEWAPALERFFAASSSLPLNRRLLLALGNTCYRRGDFYAAQGYYNRLLDILESERSRLPILLPNDRPEYIEIAERLMVARNNMGAVLEALSQRGGNPRYLAQAAGFYTQSAQAWDALTRNPQTMIRLGAGDPSSPGINLAFLNSRNILYPQNDYEPQLFVRIDKDVLEPSPWEN